MSPTPSLPLALECLNRERLQGSSLSDMSRYEWDPVDNLKRHMAEHWGASLWRQNLSSNFPPLPYGWSVGFYSLSRCIYESVAIGLGQFNAPIDASVGNSLGATLTLIALYMTELSSFVEFPFQILVMRSFARN